MGKVGFVIAVALCVTGCLEASLVACEDRMCPASSVCVPGGCASADAVEACVGVDEGGTCEAPGLARGACTGGACRALVCGDGVLAFGEQCDDGNVIGGDGCSANCASTEACGNAVLDPGEVCDDGNLLDADGCQRDCQIPRCGDGIVDVGFGEVCDDTNVVDGDGCAGNCRSSELCGNSVIDRHVGETCDDGNVADADGCQHTCQIPRCGDAILDPGELCDAGAANSAAPDAACRPSCRPATCGDGTLDGGEACDDGNLAAGDGCSADCGSDETCGNGVVDGIAGEQCDAGLRGLSADGCSSRCTAEAETWTDVSPPFPAARSGHGLAFDTARGVTVVFGGLPVREPTWEFDGVNWRPRHTAHAPAPRQYPAMAYDPVRERVVLFGGMVSGAGASDETWEYDGRDWVLRATLGTPPPRAYTTMAFDARRGRMVLFGGHDAVTPYLQDTWAYADGVWSEVTSPTSSPPPMSGIASAYDAASEEVVLFGGAQSDGGEVNQTWAFDGLHWNERGTTNPPPPRSHAGLTYDVARQRLVMFGGVGGGTALADLWELDGTVWSKRVVAGAPTARASPALSYDAARQQVVLFSGDGVTSDTQVRAGAGWQSVRMQPPAGVAAYDAGRGRTVLFAEDQTTWELVEDVWERQLPTVSPTERYQPAMTYDRNRGVIVLFGGAGPIDGQYDDTWEYDGVTWRQVLTPSSPPARHRTAMTYDAARERVVLVGGATYDLATWEYDGATWAARDPSGPGRFDATLHHDEATQRLVMVGGGLYAGTGAGETWVLGAAGWTPVPDVAPGPAPPFGPSVYDPVRRRIVLVDAARATWELDGLVWRRRPTAQLGPQSGTQMVYDAIGLRALMIQSPIVIAHAHSSAADPPDACLAGIDSDGDGLIACGDGVTLADPDCWGTCTPTCPPATSCDPGAPRCGDGACDQPREDAARCPADCP